MLQGKFRIRRPDPMLLLAIVVSFSALLTTAAAAAETGTFFSKPDLADLLDGDVTLARINRHGPVVHMSLAAPPAMQHGEQIDASAVRQETIVPEVYLSVRLPW